MQEGKGYQLKWIFTKRSPRQGAIFIPLIVPLPADCMGVFWVGNAGLAREEDALLRWEITGHFRYPSSEEEG